MEDERAGGTGPQQPSQAEGDRETIEQDLAEKQGDDKAADMASTEPRHDATPAARPPQRHPSQAEGERG